jgi:hypothetical protein
MEAEQEETPDFDGKLALFTNRGEQFRLRVL